jgi:hypothetical protein
MKKILLCSIVLVSVISCNSGDSSATNETGANARGPKTIEDTSVQHPNGITSDRPISTDTAAFGVKANKRSTKK